MHVKTKKLNNNDVYKLNMKLFNLILILFLLIPFSIGYTQLKQDPDGFYCQLGEDCDLKNLVVNNLTVIGNYYSSDGSQGITDTSSYWLCTSSNCLSSCQVQIKNGLITGCI